MRIVAWIREDGWESVIEAVAQQPSSVITLLHVAEPVHPGPGLLGRHPPRARYAEIAGAAAEELLDAAEQRLATETKLHRVAVPGRPEDIVVGACEHADLLVLARSGHHPGPHSLEHATRFVVDHAPCTVLLTWP
jgi:nucleotide-binding universal stress UspA family protein